MCDKVCRELVDLGVKASAIHGDLQQRQRERPWPQFADGSRPVLVATDVAARGIHVDDVNAVVHYDPPEDQKAYLHRSGRTARAGAGGLVVCLIEWNQELDVRRIQRRLGPERRARRWRCSPTTPASTTSPAGTRSSRSWPDPGRRRAESGAAPGPSRT